MPDLWMPGATRLDIGDHAPTDGGPAKAIGHITWDRNATAAKPVSLVPYENLVEYFGKNPAGKANAPHILWDPFTGRVTQFAPANSRTKSLADKPGGTRTNRAGSVVIQVEALFFPYCKVDGKVYAKLTDTPCKGWAQLQAWVHSWGVPNTWPMGRPTSFVPNRSASVWASKAGWYAHAHVPENDHQDPGSWPAFVTTQTTNPPAPAKPKVSVAHVVSAARKDPPASDGHTTHRAEVLVVERALKAEGLLAAEFVDGSYGTKTIAAYSRWQRSKAGGSYTGTDADGIPGAASLKRLAARHGFTVVA
ncbi:peptidoglycan-binding protein [Streptomyces bobili]|uniref:peptidoglycan-binding domain-containing protein n=1 Tax=Streptomyces bobili TaxID=67280 RepID=UPI00224F24A3|nr:peptidoglycan-binding domain-containing protein [Streptomyces bobili]MCX5522173.1 peptidoglycan-binding protein [Streptomyces bobili]